MKRLYFFGFFVLNFIFALGSNNHTTIDISTKLNLINPSRVELKSNDDVLNYKLDNSNEEPVKVYIKELNNINLHNQKYISGKFVLNSKQSNLKGKVTVRVLYN